MDYSTPQIGDLLSAAQHVARLTNESGGASVDLRTLKPYEPGQDVQMVGGSKDARTGEQFPTRMVGLGAQNPKMTVSDVLHIRNQMLPAAADNPHAVLGTWKVTDPEAPHRNRIDVDYSTAVHGDRRTAELLSVKRNEDAMFDMKDMSTTNNEEIRQKYGLRPRPQPRQSEQETVFR